VRPRLETLDADLASTERGLIGRENITATSATSVRPRASTERGLIGRENAAPTKTRRSDLRASTERGLIGRENVVPVLPVSDATLLQRSAA